MSIMDLFNNGRAGPITSLLPRLGLDDLAGLRSGVAAVPQGDVRRVLAEEGITTGDAFDAGRTVADGRFNDLLGQSTWTRPEARELQTGLNERGFNSGPVDGVVGPLTRGAIERAQAGATEARPAATPQRSVADERFDALMGQSQWTRAEGRDLQTGLRERGFDPGPVDGIVGQRTRSAMERAGQATTPPTTTEPAAEADPAPATDPANETAPEGTTTETVESPATTTVTDPADRTITDERFTTLIGQERWTPAEARDLQTGLNERGHDVGEVDGQVGPATRRGLRDARAAVATPAMANGAPQPERPGDAWVTIYPEYDITVPEDYRGVAGDQLPLGHADIVTFEDSPGGSRRATLHQFGRYNGTHGQVRTHQVPLDLNVDPATGDLTPESRQELLGYLSRNHGHGGPVEVTEVENVDIARVERFVDEFRTESAAGGNAYNIWDNNCTTFAWQAAHAGSVDTSEQSALDGRGRNTLPGWSNNWGLGDFTHYEYTPPGRE